MRALWAIRAGRAGSSFLSFAWLAAFLLLFLLQGPRLLFGAPLDTEHLALLSAIRGEGGYRIRTHFLWSNEQRHDLFFDHIRGLGGGYLGVGADQNYTLAAVAAADMVWLIDLDASVVLLHRLYGALIERAPTATDFLSCFAEQQEARVAEAVAARHPQKSDQQALLDLYRGSRRALQGSLAKTAGERREGGGTWLNQPELYDHVRWLVHEGRMVAVRGSLSGPRTMQEIGAAAQAAHLTVRVLYLSNAESWWPRYQPTFVHNVEALPFDERSQVLRTLKSLVLRSARDDAWHFSVQGAEDFQRRLKQARYRNVDTIMNDYYALAIEQDPEWQKKTRGFSLVGDELPRVAPQKLRDGIIIGRTPTPAPAPVTTASTR